MNYLLAIRNWSFRFFINSILTGIHVWWWLIVIYGFGFTGLQLLNFLVTGEWSSTSLSTWGAVSDTSLIGWNKIMNWYYEQHIMFAVFVTTMLCAVGEFFFSKLISREHRWNANVWFFDSK